VLRGFDCHRLGSWAVFSGRCCELSSVVWTRSSGVCCAKEQMRRFSRRARFLCHSQNVRAVERAGRGWRIARASMPYRFTCRARGKGACTFRNGDAALGIQSVHESGQSAGWKVANGQRGQQPTIGRRRWWQGGSGGVVAGAGLPPVPWSARACAGWPWASGERERGLARAGTGRWGSRALLGGGSMLVGGWRWLE
jgi:hypothetical protein